MKNIVKIFGFIALTVLIGFSVFSCEEVTGNNSITISGSRTEGGEIEAESSGTFAGPFTWHYSSNPDDGFFPITEAITSGNDGCMLTIPSHSGSTSLNEKYIKASRLGLGSLTYSNAWGPITTTTIVLNPELTITGTAKVGETLTASVTAASDDFSSTALYTWHYANSADSNDWTAIGSNDLSLDGTLKENLTIPKKLEEKFIKVSRMKGWRRVESNPTTTVVAP